MNIQKGKKALNVKENLLENDNIQLLFAVIFSFLVEI